jgi:chromosome segregation protein
LYLKEIEIRGFKSFANKIKLTITPGITVIVGPNGCGKSNITDAVRWILGEQNIRSLRGNNLADMIFAGNDNQKMRNYAEVSILLDNADRKLFMDTEQVELKRVIYRSGNTENYINGLPCKLRDIHNLFLGTGLGKNSYSIIAQGKVDFVLNSKPSERRVLFEEAANISNYRNKKEATIKRLDTVKNNLLRINDILSEVKENLNYYKKKADDLQLYYSYRDIIKKSEFYLLSQQYLLYQKKIVNFNKMFANLREELKTIEGFLNNHKKKIIQAEEKKELLEKEINEIEKFFQENETERINYNNQLILLKQKQTEITQRIKSIHEDIDTSNEQYKKFKETVSSIEKDIQKTEYNNSIILENKTNKDVLLKNYNKIDMFYDKAISNIRLNIEKFFDKKINRYKEQKIEEQTLLKATEYSLSEIKNEYLSVSEELKRSQKSLYDAENNLAYYENEKMRQQQEKTYLENSLNKSKLLMEQEDNILQNFNNDIVLRTKEKEFLVELTKSQPNKENKINEYIIKRNNIQNQFSSFSKIFEIIQFIPDNLKNIFHFILNDKFPLLITSNSKIVNDLNNVLKTNNINQVKLIIDNNYRIARIDDYQEKIDKEYSIQSKILGFANKLIKFSPEYNNLFKILLGKILIVEDINTALKIHKYQKGNLSVVSLDGVIIDSNGIVFLNINSENNKNYHILLPAEKIVKIDKDISRIKKDIVEHNKIYNVAKNDKLQFAKRIEELDNKIDIYVSKINKYNNNVLESNKKIAGLETRLKDLKLKKIAEIEKKQKINKNIEYFKSSLDKITSYTNLVESYYFCLSKIRNNCNKNVEDLKKVIENCKMEIGWNQERNTILQKRKVEMEHFVQTYNNEDKIRKEKLLQYNNEKLRLIKETDILEKNIKKTTEQRKDLDDRRSKLKESIKNQEREIRKTYEEIEIYQRKLEEKKNKQHETEMGKVQNQEKMNHLLTTIKEQYNSSVDEIMLHKNDVSSQKEAYTKITKYKEKITAMGQLNFDALQEYKNQSDRYNDLKNKKNDINQSKEKLINLIKEIDCIAEDNFYKTYLKVENNFKDIFKKLFNGGHVSLELTNKNKILETGIEVMVQPPGKKLQHISLLSTGEKALTAIALLFALWKANPSPFCFFDEIDSALDEANAIRLATFLRNEDLKDAQIIIITHQRGVMESADALYGITMEGSGVSKLMSVKISDTEEKEN